MRNRKTLRVRNGTRGSDLGDRIGVADGYWSRLRGLLWRPALEEGEGLLILPCGGVHMYGMKFALDVLFLDQERRVVAMYPSLVPGTRTRMHRKARAALELPEGTIARSGTEEGDILNWSAEEVAVRA